MDKNPIEMNDFDFLDWARKKFSDDEWDRLCDLLEDDGYDDLGWEN